MAIAEPVKPKPNELRQASALDYGPMERWRRGDVELRAIDSERLPVGRVLVECRLDWYEKRSLISECQHKAGIQIRHLFRRAVLPPATTGSYGPAVSGGGDMADTADARWRLQEALLGACLGRAGNVKFGAFQILMINGEQVFPEFPPLRLTAAGHVVMAVCGLDEWAGGAERLMRLREGLGDLADYWQLER